MHIADYCTYVRTIFSKEEHPVGTKCPPKESQNKSASEINRRQYSTVQFNSGISRSSNYYCSTLTKTKLARSILKKKPKIKKLSLVSVKERSVYA